MKSFKQFLKESKQLKEAKIDSFSDNLFFDIFNAGFLLDIINRYANSKGEVHPVLRMGYKQYDIKGNFTGIDSNEKEKELDTKLNKMQDDIRKDILKTANKFENDVKSILKKYGVNI